MNTMRNNSISISVKPRIMRRVYGVWLAKLLAPVVFFELPVFVALIKLSSNYIFVKRVLENMAESFSGITQLINFLTHAFLNTSIETKIVLALSAIITVWLVKDVARSIKSITRFMVQKVPLYR